MALVRTYDDPDTMYKLNPDGESAETLVVLGKDAFDKAKKEGWSETRPNIRYPLTLYRAIPEAELPKDLQGKGITYGATRRIENRNEENAAKAEGWQEQAIRGLPPAPEAWQLPDPAKPQPVQVNGASPEMLALLVQMQTQMNAQAEQIKALLEEKAADEDKPTKKRNA